MYALTFATSAPAQRSVDDGTTTPAQAEQIAQAALASWQTLERNGELLTEAVNLARASINQAVDHARAQIERALETLNSENDAHKDRFERMENEWAEWAEPSDVFNAAYNETGSDIDDAISEAEDFLNELPSSL